ncbi:MAG TPA: hypothetical protein VGB83_08575 [Actinomycetota bacterium]
MNALRAKARSARSIRSASERVVFGVVGMAMLTAACTGGGVTTAGSQAPSVTPSAPAETPTPDGQQSAQRASRQRGGSDSSKAAPPFEPDPTLPVESSVTPECARIGDLVTLSVETEPGATVAYQAVYSNGKSGAGSGYGGDYGGNDAGQTDDQGEYSSSWTLTNNPPPGPVRVDVYVFTLADGNTYDTARFTVAELAGSCQT